MQQPQWAQYAALGDHLGVVDVKHGGLGIGRLVQICLPNFGQKGEGETVEQHSKRCIHVLQRVDARHLLGDCRDRDREGSRSFTGDAEASSTSSFTCEDKRCPTQDGSQNRDVDRWRRRHLQAVAESNGC